LGGCACRKSGFATRKGPQAEAHLPARAGLLQRKGLCPSRLQIGRCVFVGTCPPKTLIRYRSRRERKKRTTSDPLFDSLSRPQWAAFLIDS